MVEVILSLFLKKIDPSLRPCRKDKVVVWIVGRAWKNTTQ